MTRRHVNDRVNGDTETSIKQPLTSICLCHGSVFVQFSSAKDHAYLPNCNVFTRMYSFCNMLETKVGSFGRIGPRRQLAGVGITSAGTMRSNRATLSIYMRRCQIKVQFECGVKTKFLATSFQSMTFISDYQSIPRSHSFQNMYNTYMCKMHLKGEK